MGAIKIKMLCLGMVLTLTLTQNSIFSQTWRSVAIGAGGFVSSIITSKQTPDIMYVRTDVGGAYRWNVATTTWVPLSDWASDEETGYMGVEALALDPQADNKVYMLVGTSYFNGGKTALLRSTDYGNTFAMTDVSAEFTAHGNGMGRQNGERLAVDPNNGNILFCGSRANGLFKSANAGAAWTSVSAFGVTTTPNGNGINFVVFDPAGTAGAATQTFFVGVSRTGAANLYKTSNGGVSFTEVTGGPGTSLMPQRAVLASDKNLYITYANNEGPWNIGSGQLWKYNTTANTWTNITPAGSTSGFSGISVDPTDPARVIASTINLYSYQYTDLEGNNVWGDYIFLSTNGGISWRNLIGGAGIIMNANGSSWINGHSIHWAGCIEFNPFNTNQAWVTSGNGIFSCDDLNAAQTTWKFNVKDLEETVPLDIASITGGPLISVIGDYDGFVHTDVTAYAPIHTPGMGTTTGLAYAATNTNKLLRVGNSMYYSNNQGTDWTQCTMNGTKGKVALSADGNTFLHCPEGSNTMYRSVNNGGVWSACAGVNIPDAVPVADFVNAAKFYAYDNNSGNLYVSTNGGSNFSVAGNAGAGGSRIIRSVPGNEGHLWIALYGGGLIRSINSGASFTNSANVTYCAAVGLGKAAPAAAYYTIYIWGTVGGVRGVFRSIDQGATWTRVNDDAHEFGGPGNGQFVIGDMNIYGRVYMSTVGRGIVYSETGTPLPVEFNSFRAVSENEHVKLVWETESEENNDFFIVEKSSDGNYFQELGTVKGAGNSSSLNKYNFTDENPYPGISYYRLKQVDSNGEFSYSEIKAVDLKKSTKVEIFPNPARNSFFVNTDNAGVQLVDLSGKLFLWQEDISKNEPINIAHIAPGMYVVQITTGDEIFLYKFIKE